LLGSGNLKLNALDYLHVAGLKTIIWVELTKEQRYYYKAIMENRISELLKGSQSSNMPNLRNIVSYLWMFEV
jgi:hypothetical protein